MTLPPVAFGLMPGHGGARGLQVGTLRPHRTGHLYCCNPGEARHNDKEINHHSPPFAMPPWGKPPSHSHHHHHHHHHHSLRLFSTKMGIYLTLLLLPLFVGPSPGLTDGIPREALQNIREEGSKTGDFSAIFNVRYRLQCSC